MIELNCITCKSCGESYLVGIGGKSIKDKGSGGNLDGTPYMSIGSNELKDEPITLKEGDTYLCPNCGAECIIENAKEVK